MINKIFFKFFNFILGLKKKYIYVYAYIYFLIKYNSSKVPIIGLNDFKFMFNTLKFNFVFLLKKYVYNLKLYKIFTKFFLLQLYNKSKIYFKRLIFYNLKSKDIFKIIKNSDFKIANSLLALKKIYIYNKLPYCFFINKKKIKINKKKVNNGKKLKNLFSLFFFNLFIYLFFIYLFIYWINILLSNNKLKIVKIFILKFSEKIPFYKLCYKANYKKKKIKIIYSLSNLNLNKYYLIYNKLNLIKQL